MLNDSSIKRMLTENACFILVHETESKQEYELHNHYLNASLVNNRLDKNWL
jgi:hypothetical protein